MRPEDLELLRVPGEPTVSRDGGRIVVAVGRPDVAGDRYLSELYLVDPAGTAAPRRLTRGHRDTEPALHPGGDWLVFCRAVGADRPGLYLLPLDGGEPLALPPHPLGVSRPCWSPDGTRLAYLARVPEPGRYAADGDPDAEPPRRITTLRYRLDNVGFTEDQPEQLFVIEPFTDEPAPRWLAGGPGPRWLTGGPAVSAPSWLPDGTGLLVAAARHPDRDTRLASDVWRVDLRGGEPVRLTDTSTTADAPVVGPDGATVYYLGTDRLDLAGRATGCFAVPLDGSAPPRRISDPAEDELAESGTLNRLRPVPGGLLAARSARGTRELVRLATDGGRPTVLLGGPRQVRGFDVTADGVVVAVVTDGTCAGELVVVGSGAAGAAGGEPGGKPGDAAGGERTVSDFGAALAATGRLHPLTELTATAPDGYPVHGWLVRPAGEGPFPVLLVIHGGPDAQYGHALFDEAQVYAGTGYAVVLGNPRGSAGYGEAHARAIVGDFGNRDAADLLALLDAALATGDLDPGRVGVMGGSYGGFMTSWLLTHTDRFRAAISERAVNDFASLVGSSDIGYYFTDLYLGTDPDRVAACSPINHVHPGCPPTLVIHSERDWRTPIEQGQRFYVALRRAGVPAELLLFPGEGHELTRSGRPLHRLQRFAAVLEWWDRHLGPAAASEAPAEPELPAAAVGAATGSAIAAGAPAPAR